MYTPCQLLKEKVVFLVNKPLTPISSSSPNISYYVISRSGFRKQKLMDLQKKCIEVDKGFIFIRMCGKVQIFLLKIAILEYSCFESDYILTRFVFLKLSCFCLFIVNFEKVWYIDIISLLTYLHEVPWWHMFSWKLTTSLPGKTVNWKIGESYSYSVAKILQ